MSSILLMLFLRKRSHQHLKTCSDLSRYQSLQFKYYSSFLGDNLETKFELKFWELLDPQSNTFTCWPRHCYWQLLSRWTATKSARCDQSMCDLSSSKVSPASICPAASTNVCLNPRARRLFHLGMRKLWSEGHMIEIHLHLDNREPSLTRCLGEKSIAGEEKKVKARQRLRDGEERGAVWVWWREREREREREMNESGMRDVLIFPICVCFSVCCVFLHLCCQHHQCSAAPWIYQGLYGLLYKQG